jgi:hypothetical protein
MFDEEWAEKRKMDEWMNGGKQARKQARGPASQTARHTDRQTDREREAGTVRENRVKTQPKTDHAQLVTTRRRTES